MKYPIAKQYMAMITIPITITITIRVIPEYLFRPQEPGFPVVSLELIEED
jgi:hypothetical protein